jgi:hypothetical protein
MDEKQFAMRQVVVSYFLTNTCFVLKSYLRQNTKKQTTVADNEAKMAKQKFRCMTEDLGTQK